MSAFCEIRLVTEVAEWLHNGIVVLCRIGVKQVRVYGIRRHLCGDVEIQSKSGWHLLSSPLDVWPLGKEFIC